MLQPDISPVSSYHLLIRTRMRFSAACAARCLLCELAKKCIAFLPFQSHYLSSFPPLARTIQQHDPNKRIQSRLCSLFPFFYLEAWKLTSFGDEPNSWSLTAIQKHVWMRKYRLWYHGQIMEQLRLNPIISPVKSKLIHGLLWICILIF